MGVDPTILANHALRHEGRLSWSMLGKAVGSLNVISPEIENTLKYCKDFVPDCHRWDWARSHRFGQMLSQFNVEKSVSLEGPGHMRIDVHLDYASISPPMRWWTILNEPSIRAELLEYAGQITRAIGGSSFLCIPDSLHEPSLALDAIYQGGCYSDVGAWLRKNIGSPSQWNGDGGKQRSAPDPEEFYLEVQL